MSIVEVILSIAEYLGIMAFAISGVMLAARKKLDLFGCLMLGCVTSVGGGLMRDLILGITPPLMFTDPSYVLTAAVTSSVVIALLWFSGDKFDMENPVYLSVVNITDAIGLGIFSAIGVSTACMQGYLENAFLCIFVGTLTGVGGGMISDIFAGKIPRIFRKNIYLIASLIGSILYYVMYNRGVGDIAGFSITAIVVLIIRVLATKYHWNMPKLG